MPAPSASCHTAPPMMRPSKSSEATSMPAAPRLMACSMRRNARRLSCTRLRSTRAAHASSEPGRSASM
eukprot:scaffold6871_cov75-Phaeocystis_antarctica.AAC.7